MITILGAGVAGASLAWALAKRGRKDVVVFDPSPVPAGSTSNALGGFRTQHGSELNIRLAVASRGFFTKRHDRIGFQPNGYLYLAATPDAAQRASPQSRIPAEVWVAHRASRAW